MPDDLRRLMKLVTKNTDGSELPTKRSPEEIAWLREAFEAYSIDLGKKIKDDVTKISSLLANKDHANDHDYLEELEPIIEDLMDATENLDLSDIFIKVGGVDVLLKLLFDAPIELRENSLQILANITQNYRPGQIAFFEKGIIPNLVNMLDREQSVLILKKLFSALSCLVRDYEDGISAFIDSNGFDVMTRKLRQLVGEHNPQMENLFSKISFTLYCLLNDFDLDRINKDTILNLCTGIMDATFVFKAPQEHFLTSLSFLLCKASQNSQFLISNLSPETTDVFISKLTKRINETDNSETDELAIQNCAQSLLSKLKK